MQLPIELRSLVDQLLAGAAVGELAIASARLTTRYRGEVVDGHMHLDTDAAAKAYIAARFPATYAAIHTALEQIVNIYPDFSPETMLDAGAGPATAVLAASNVFDSLVRADLYEQSAAIRNIGEALSASLSDCRPHWHQADLSTPDACGFAAADLTSLCYVLDELSSLDQDRLVEALWQKTNGVMLLVEPGTPQGWLRLMHQRQRLLDMGGYLIAPCPHQGQCPLKVPDWCHFSVRLDRSKMHMRTKGAERSYEDEKFIYLAFSKVAVGRQPYAFDRIIAPVRKSSNKIELKLCQHSGKMYNHLVTKSMKETYRLARRSMWGDIIEVPKVENK